MNTVYLGLGCNLGNRMESLKSAIVKLGHLGEVFAESKIYESPAWGYEDERSYLNMCCGISTNLSIEAIHKATLDIEVALGRETAKRKEGEPYRPRMIDIDILFFNEELIKTEALIVPHPQLHLRNFVLRPLVDIAPDFQHPSLGVSMLELLRTSLDQSELQELG